MPNSYTAGVIDGEYDALDYLMHGARQFGFAIHQRDDPFDNPVEYRKVSEYYQNRVDKAIAAQSEWNGLRPYQIRQRYREYITKTKASNEQALARSAEVKPRLQAVRDDLLSLDWPEDLQEMRAVMLKWLDETEDMDGRAWTHSVVPYEEWVQMTQESVDKEVEWARKSLSDEIERCQEQNKYCDLFYGVITQLEERVGRTK